MTAQQQNDLHPSNNSYWVVPPEWAGQTVCILAGGPSLTRTEATLTWRHRVIAINDNYDLLPNAWSRAANVLYFRDLPWWKANQEGVWRDSHARWMVTCEHVIPGVCRLRDTGPFGLETDPGGLRQGGNSGYQAVNLAYHFGARRIILLGYDMQAAANGRTHRRGNRTGTSAGEYNRRCHKWLQAFESLAAAMPLDVEVLNASPGSALQCWPQVKLEDVL